VSEKKEREWSIGEMFAADRYPVPNFRIEPTESGSPRIKGEWAVPLGDESTIGVEGSYRPGDPEFGVMGRYRRRF
jgi:hypothetical protein